MFIFPPIPLLSQPLSWAFHSCLKNHTDLRDSLAAPSPSCKPLCTWHNSYCLFWGNALNILALPSAVRQELPNRRGRPCQLPLIFHGSAGPSSLWVWVGPAASDARCYLTPQSSVGVLACGVFVPDTFPFSLVSQVIHLPDTGVPHWSSLSLWGSLKLSSLFSLCAALSPCRCCDGLE